MFIFLTVLKNGAVWCVNGMTTVRFCMFITENWSGTKEIYGVEFGISLKKNGSTKVGKEISVFI